MTEFIPDSVEHCFVPVMKRQASLRYPERDLRRVVWSNDWFPVLYNHHPAGVVVWSVVHDIVEVFLAFKSYLEAALSQVRAGHSSFGAPPASQERYELPYLLFLRVGEPAYECQCIVSNGLSCVDLWGSDTNERSL